MLTQAIIGLFVSSVVDITQAQRITDKALPMTEVEVVKNGGEERVEKD